MSAHLRSDVPGLDRELARLVALYKQIGLERRGHVVFVAGDDGSGRSALMRRVAGELSGLKPPAIVLAGGFQDAAYVGWDQDTLAPRVRTLLERALGVSESAAGLASNFLPLAGLLGQAAAASKAGLEFLESMVGEQDVPDLSVLMPRMLRRLCEDGPVVCVIDHADQAPGGWWSDLVLLFARRIAKDLPLLLVLAVDGPEQLGGHEDDERDALFVARALTRDGLAQWHPLTPLTVEDLSRWTGPAMPEVLRELIEVTGGRADWAAELWRDWQRRLVIAQTLDDRRWCFVAGRERALDEVEDLLDDRLRDLIGITDLNALESARRLLCCGALEGREFTADAVAIALGRDRIEVIDWIDETIAQDDENSNGLVVEAGYVQVDDETGKRSLWRYRFTAKLDWLTLRHHGLSDTEQRDLSLRLAHAMRTLYGGQAHRVAHTLSRLFTTAGQVDDARHFLRMGDIDVGRAVVLWRARNVLISPLPKGRSERRRAFLILLAAANALIHSGPFDEGLEFALAAHRLADHQDNQAHALYLSGIAQIHLGYTSHARHDCDRALELFRGLDQRHGEAAARHALAKIDFIEGESEKARTGYIAVLKLQRDRGDREGEARTRHELAVIGSIRGENEEARTELVAVADLQRALGDRVGEAYTRHELVRIDLKRDEYEKARTELVALLDLHRELGDRAGEGRTRYGLASIDFTRGEYEKARTEFVAVLDLQRELGDRAGEAYTRHELAVIDTRRGEYEKARTGFVALLDLWCEIGDRTGVARARHELAAIDLMRGEYEEARTEFLAVLDLFCELGDRASEVRTRHHLAVIDSRRGEYEKAQTQFVALLDLRRELGDRAGEVLTRHELAVIDFGRGEDEEARTEFVAVLDLQRELGDRAGVARTRHYLAVIDSRRGEYEKARTELVAVLDLQRELGDHAGAAATQTAITRIDAAFLEL